MDAAFFENGDSVAQAKGFRYIMGDEDHRFLQSGFQ
jgi:hypothetical protein